MGPDFNGSPKAVDHDHQRGEQGHGGNKGAYGYGGPGSAVPHIASGQVGRYSCKAANYGRQHISKADQKPGCQQGKSNEKQ